MVAAERLVAHPMDLSMMERAFPLAVNLAPNVTLTRWNEFARSFLARRDGVWSRGFMGIQNAAGYILGLFSFEIRDELEQGRTLRIENIVVPTMPGRELIVQALTDAIDDLAAKHDCRLVCANLTGKPHRLDTDRKWIGLALERAGYQIEEKTALRRQIVRSTVSFLPSVELSK
jgi:hypothetical protein